MTPARSCSLTSPPRAAIATARSAIAALVMASAHVLHRVTLSLPAPRTGRALVGPGTRFWTPLPRFLPWPWPDPDQSPARSLAIADGERAGTTTARVIIVHVVARGTPERPGRTPSPPPLMSPSAAPRQPSATRPSRATGIPSPRSPAGAQSAATSTRPPPTASPHSTPSAAPSPANPGYRHSPPSADANAPIGVSWPGEVRRKLPGGPGQVPPPHLDGTRNMGCLEHSGPPSCRSLGALPDSCPGESARELPERCRRPAPARHPGRPRR